MLGIGLIGGSILSAFPFGKNAFEQKLSENQMAIWSEIRKERFSIYLFSLTVALLVARSMSNKLYATIVSSSLTASLYTVLPKNKYMADYLNVEQRKELREVYRQQIWKYHGTIVLALLGIPFICSKD